MPSPVYSVGTIGNTIAAVSVAHSTVTAAFLPLSSSIEGQVSCQIVTGSSPPTAATIFSAYKVVAAAPNTMVSSFGSSTSITVASAANFNVGEKILLQQASGSKLGETATISAISTNTLTVSTLVNTYSSGDNVYKIDQTATFSAAPSSTTGTWVASKTYSAALFLGAGQWAIEASNTDASYAVTVTVSTDQITGFA